MKLFLHAFFITCAVILASCTKETYTITEKDGVTTVYNKNIPSSPDLDVKLKKVFSINRDNYKDSLAQYNKIGVYTVNNSGEVLISDMLDQKIRVYDKMGNYGRDFGAKGNGPGEFVYILGMVPAGENLLVYNASDQLFNLLDKDGKYIDKFGCKSAQQVMNPVNMGSNVVSTFYNFKDGKFTVSLGITDNHMNLIKEGDVRNVALTEQGSCNIYDVQKFFTAGENRLYLSSNSDDEYCINIYDSNFNKKRAVKKAYIKTKISDLEWEENKGSMRYITFTGTKNEMKYKRPVGNIYLDKEENLWVNTPKREDDKNKGFKFDIFSKEGIFLNSVYLGFNYINTYSHIFKGDRIYCHNLEDDCIDVYEYTLTGR